MVSMCMSPIDINICIYFTIFHQANIQNCSFSLFFFIKTPHKELQNLYFDVYVNIILGSIALLENRTPPPPPPPPLIWDFWNLERLQNACVRLPGVRLG